MTQGRRLLANITETTMNMPHDRLEICMVSVALLAGLTVFAGCEAEPSNAVEALQAATETPASAEVSLDLYTSSDEHIGASFVGPADKASELRQALLDSLADAFEVAEQGDPNAVELVLSVAGVDATSHAFALPAGSLDGLLEELGHAALPVAAELGFSPASPSGDSVASLEAELLATGTSSSGATSSLGSCKCQVKEYMCKPETRCITGWGCWTVQVCRWVCVQEICG